MSKSQQDITAVLSQVAKAVVGKFSMEELLNEILKITMETLEAEVCSVFLIDPDNLNQIVCVAGAGYAENLVGKARYKVGQGFTGGIFESGKSHKIDSPDEMKRLLNEGSIKWDKIHDPIQWKGYEGVDQFRNLMALPLKNGEEIFGVIKVENKKDKDSCFSEEDFELFQAISNIVITLTLQNARVQEQRHNQSKMIMEVVNAVVGSLDMQSLLDKILVTTMNTFKAEACSIFLQQNNDKNTIECVVGKGYADNIQGKIYNKGEGVTGHVFGTGNSYNVKSKGELVGVGWLGKYDHIQWKDGANQFRNLMILPLKIADEILGVIKVENKKQDVGIVFSEDEFQSFKIIANMLALMIKNAQLYETQTILKTISAKAAHKINNQIARYDFIKLALHDEIVSWLPSKRNLKDLEERIAQTTDSLKRLTDDFKSYSKDIVLEPKNADLNQIIKDEADAVKRTHDIKIETDLLPDLPKFSFDNARLSESIREMLGNSVKAKANNIWISTKHESNQAVIIIKDDGTGVEKDFANKLFMPFHSTRPDGTGLGLSTVKETIEKHGGTIQLKTSEKGACFEITLLLNTQNQ
jgi:signal transduction histidine kinase